MYKGRWYVAAGFVVVVMYLFFFSGQSTKHVSSESGFRPVMGTFARVVAVAGDLDTANKCIEAAFGELELVDELMSDYKADSQLSEVNREAYERPVKVAGPVFEVLQRSVEFSSRSDGAFDITVGPLVDMFRAAGQSGIAPGPVEVNQVKSKVGFDKLQLNQQDMTVRFAAEGMRLDLGGIAKGYAIDKAIEAMRNSGAAGGMVDVGGDVRCFGRPVDGPYWLVGVQDPSKAKPDDISAEAMFILKINDGAVATSGNYRRFVEVEGKKLSHIIEAAAAKTSESLSSVTIICPNAIDADALATAVSVMGAEKGLAFIEKRQNTEAILISTGPEYEIMQTMGAKKYLK